MQFIHDLKKSWYSCINLINFNRGANAAQLIIASALVGAMGGYAGYYASGAYVPIEASTSFETASSTTFIEPQLDISVMSDFAAEVSFETEISSVSEASFIENLSLDSAVDMFPMAM